jgi:N-acetylglutamate synthase-like GNAT family acetyltransferase
MSHEAVDSDGGILEMGQAQSEAIEWDWVVLDRRGRLAGRAATYAVIVSGAALVVGVATLAIAPGLDGLATVGLLMWLVSSVVAVAARLIGENVFLLEPGRYFAWLRELGPYEPESPWEQHVGKFAAFVRDVGALAVSAFVGAQIVSQPDQSRMIADAVTWLGILLLLGIPFVWWTGFLIGFGAHHLRAIRRGTLPIRPHGGSFLGLFLLFATLWFFGIVVLVLVLHLASEVLRAYGFPIQ